MMVILAIVLVFATLTILCVIQHLSDQRWNQKMFSEQADIIDRIIGFLPGDYVHEPGGCTDPGCPCIQAYESQKQAR
jgi:hypothetical protein